MRNSTGKVENLYFRDPKYEILSFHHESFCTSVSGIYHPAVFPEHDRKHTTDFHLLCLTINYTHTLTLKSRKLTND